MTYAEGIDISYAQGTTPSLAGLDFVIVKASEGTGVDPRWAQHSKAVRAAGKMLLAYHFGRRESSVAAQVSTFINVAHAADGWALDYEPSNAGTLMTPAQARAFFAEFRRRTGRTIGLYQALYHPRPYPSDSYGANWRWVAYWGPNPPPVRWDFWQYRGIHLDRDRYHGDVDALREFLGLQPAPAPVPEGDGMTNLVPMTCHRVVDVPGGIKIYQEPGGDVHTTVPAGGKTFGFIAATMGAQSGWYQIADGDYGVYVQRSVVTVRTADMNVGA